MMNEINPIVPIYYQIKQNIRNAIINKEFKLGDKIPSGNKLAEKFNVSKLTVRHAISQLIQEGFLISKRGEGTFVTRNKELIDSFGIEFRGFIDGIFYPTGNLTTKYVKITRMAGSYFVDESLGLKGKDVIQIKRVRFKEEKSFSYVVNYLPIEIGEEITVEQLYKKPMLEILQYDFGIEFTEAFQTMEATFAGQEVAEKLKILSGSPILYIERIMYMKNRIPVELVQASYRGDLKYVLRLKSAKRKNRKIWVHEDGNK